MQRYKTKIRHPLGVTRICRQGVMDFKKKYKQKVRWRNLSVKNCWKKNLQWNFTWNLVQSSFEKNLKRKLLNRALNLKEITNWGSEHWNLNITRAVFYGAAALLWLLTSDSHDTCGNNEISQHQQEGQSLSEPQHPNTSSNYNHPHFTTTASTTTTTNTPALLTKIVWSSDLYNNMFNWWLYYSVQIIGEKNLLLW